MTKPPTKAAPPPAGPSRRPARPARPQVSIRVDAATLALLDAMAARLPLDRSTIMRAALRLGAERIEDDPLALLDPGGETRREALAWARATIEWAFFEAGATPADHTKAVPMDALRAAYATRHDAAGFEADLAAVVAAGLVEVEGGAARKTRRSII